MPVHDWTRVEPGIFHDFHHAWIEELKWALNSDLLPQGYYALAEQHAAGFGPDVLALDAQGDGRESMPRMSDGRAAPARLLLAPPRVQVMAETEMYSTAASRTRWSCGTSAATEWWPWWKWSRRETRRDGPPRDRSSRRRPSCSSTASTS